MTGSKYYPFEPNAGTRIKTKEGYVWINGRSTKVRMPRISSTKIARHTLLLGASVTGSRYGGGLSGGNDLMEAYKAHEGAHSIAWVSKATQKTETKRKGGKS